jgi:hypothetical protein
MFRSLPRTSAAILLVMPLLFAACDELEDDELLAPTGSRFAAPTVNTLVIPATTLPFQILPVLGCPFAPPFVSRFSLLVDPIDVDLTMTEVGLQFVDTAGIVSPVSFDQNDLTGLFGTTHVAAGIQRTFPFQATFGCNFQTTPHVLRGRAVFVNPLGHRMERAFEGRFGN